MKRTVIKLGGALLTQPLDTFWSAIAELQASSEVILVHGGGPQTTALARKLGHEPVIIQGRRVTSDMDLDILNWVIRGELNVSLVAAAHQHGVRAVGLSGADGGILQVTKRPPWTIEGETIDFGHVGDVESVDATTILALFQGGAVPVICPPGIDSDGNLYNVNADTTALEIAVAVGASDLLLLTDTGAVLDEAGERVRRMDAHAATDGVSNGWIQGGMKVKTDVGFEALQRGVSNVWIAGLDSVVHRSSATRLIPVVGD